MLKKASKNPRKRPGRPSKESLLPYRVLVILLYGRFRWVDRGDDGVIVIAAPLACHYLQVRRRWLYAAIETLDNWGLIRTFKGGKYYLRVEPAIPKGMAISISGRVVEAEEDTGNALDVLLETTEGRDSDRESTY